jgi:hypothetical protein
MSISAHVFSTSDFKMSAVSKLHTLMLLTKIPKTRIPFCARRVFSYDCRNSGGLTPQKTDICTNTLLQTNPWFLLTSWLTDSSWKLRNFASNVGSGFWPLRERESERVRERGGGAAGTLTTEQQWVLAWHYWTYISPLCTLLTVPQMVSLPTSQWNWHWSLFPQDTDHLTHSYTEK